MQQRNNSYPTTSYQSQPHHHQMQQQTLPESSYNMPTTGAEAYWPQEPAASSSGYPCLPQEHASSYPVATVATAAEAFPSSATFGANSDLFQPEEIFQLDQPLRPDFTLNSSNNNNNQDSAVTRSPPSLLDLGSGTIKYELPEINPHEQTYWTQLLSEDSSSSHVSGVTPAQVRGWLTSTIIYFNDLKVMLES